MTAVWVQCSQECGDLSFGETAGKLSKSITHYSQTTCSPDIWTGNKVFSNCCSSFVGWDSFHMIEGPILRRLAKPSVRFLFWFCPFGAQPQCLKSQTRWKNSESVVHQIKENEKEEILISKKWWKTYKEQLCKLLRFYIHLYDVTAPGHTVKETVKCFWPIASWAICSLVDQ